MYFTKRMCEDNKLRENAGEKPKFYFIAKSFHAVLIPEMQETTETDFMRGPFSSKKQSIAI